MVVLGGAAPLAFVIVGTSRSGTTLVQRLACELPGVSVPPETHFLSNFALGLVARRRFPLPPEVVEEELDRYLALPSCRGLALSPAQVATGFDGGCGSVFELFAAVVAQLAADAPVVGEKTPEHLLWWRPLTCAWPGLKVVAVVRDPRAVVASNLAAPFGMGTTELLAERWAADQRELTAARQALRPEQLLVLRYEDVVADPVDARLRLARHLGVAVTASSGAPATSARLGDQQGRLYHEWETWKSRVDDPVTTDRIDAWREHLSVRALRVIEAVCRAGMVAARYEPVPTVLGAAVARARLKPAAQVRRARYRWARRRLLAAINRVPA